MIRRKALATDASIPIKSNSTLCSDLRWIFTLKFYATRISKIAAKWLRTLLPNYLFEFLKVESVANTGILVGVVTSTGLENSLT